MLFPIERLLNGRDKPLCIRGGQTVWDALALIVENETTANCLYSMRREN
jgi:hypothetical protein